MRAILGAPRLRGVPVAGRPVMGAVMGAVMGVLLALLPPVAVEAQFAVDRTELELHPDVADGRVGVLLVRNEGTQREQARLFVEDWDRDADGANRFHPAGSLAGSCHSYLTVEPRTLVLDPGESQPIRVRIDSGAVAAGRECWSVVLVESVQPRTAGTGRVLLYTVRTGVKVYAASAVLLREMAITAMTMQWPTVVAAAGSTTPAPSGPSATTTTSGTANPSPQAVVTGAVVGDSLPTVQLAVTNSGARHLTARGRIEFRREDNSVVASVPLPVVYALPGATRRLSTVLPPLSRGRYLCLAVFDYGGSELTAAQLDVEIP